MDAHQLISVKYPVLLQIVSAIQFWVVSHNKMIHDQSYAYHYV